MSRLQRAAPLAEPSHPFWTGKGRLCVPTTNDSAPWHRLPNITISLQTDHTTAFDVTITYRVGDGPRSPPRGAEGTSGPAAATSAAAGRCVVLTTIC